MRTFFIRNIYPKIFASPYFLAILGMFGSLTLVVSASFLLISPQCVTYSFCRQALERHWGKCSCFQMAPRSRPLQISFQKQSDFPLFIEFQNI